MAQFGVAITKKVSFRGADQEFTNVYHYTGPTLSVSDATALAGQIKTKEVSFHSTDVVFVRYKVWTSGGGQAQNQMVAAGSLSGTGNQAVNTNMDRERAVLVMFAAGFDIRGHPVKLRKWYHSCGGCGDIAFGATVLQNTAQIASADRTTIANIADDLLVLTQGGGTYNLCAESGRAGGTPVEVHRYLEHHQLGDMWR